jgi:hypothetical protein
LRLCVLLCSEQVVASDVLCEANIASKGACIEASGTAELSLESSTVRFNNATVNGGGAAIEWKAVLHLDPVNTFLEYNIASEYGGGVLALSSGFVAADLIAAVHNNTARYDADISVAFTNITLLGNNFMADFVSRPGAGEGVLPVRLSVSGYYGLPCEGAVVAAALDGMYTLGTSTSDADGMIDMILRIQQPPGDYNIMFSITDDPSITPAVLRLHIRNCSRGEVAPSADTCEVCLPGSYSLHPSQATCQPCPAAGASCPGGAALVPLPGWWHSAADSAQMHR